jgi:hypothetical protein
VLVLLRELFGEEVGELHAHRDGDRARDIEWKCRLHESSRMQDRNVRDGHSLVRLDRVHCLRQVVGERRARPKLQE